MQLFAAGVLLIKLSICDGVYLVANGYVLVQTFFFLFLVAKDETCAHHGFTIRNELLTTGGLEIAKFRVDFP